MADNKNSQNNTISDNDKLSNSAYKPVSTTDLSILIENAHLLRKFDRYKPRYVAALVIIQSSGAKHMGIDPAFWNAVAYTNQSIGKVALNTYVGFHTKLLAGFIDTFSDGSIRYSITLWCWLPRQCR